MMVLALEEMSSSHPLYISEEKQTGSADGLDEGYEGSQEWQSFLARTTRWKMVPFTSVENTGDRSRFLGGNQELCFWPIVFLMLFIHLNEEAELTVGHVIQTLGEQGKVKIEVVVKVVISLWYMKPYKHTESPRDWVQGFRRKERPKDGTRMVR